MASPAKTQTAMLTLINLLGALDLAGIAKVEALALSIRARANPKAAMVAAKARVRPLAVGAQRG